MLASSNKINWHAPPTGNDKKTQRLHNATPFQLNYATDSSKQRARNVVFYERHYTIPVFAKSEFVTPLD